MAPQEPPNEITIRVKVPPGHIRGAHEDEFPLGSLSTNLPLTALRQRVQTLIPGNPAPAQQRILYGGRALVEDSQSIADALNTKRDPTQTEYVVHLLIKNSTGDQARAEVGGTHTRIATAQPPAQAPIQPQPLQAHGVLPQGVAMPGMNPMAPFAGWQGFPGMMGLNGAGNINDPAQRPPRAQPQSQPGPEPHLPQLVGSNSAPPVQPGAQQPAPHNHNHLNPQNRPISGQGFQLSGTGPNGQRFAIHQQTLNFPAMAVHGGQPQFGIPMQPFPPGGIPQMPGLGLPFPMPGMAQHIQQQHPPAATTGPSALERARENVTQMRRMLETMRNEHAASEETRTRVVEMEQRIQAVNDYIDPFRMGGRIPANANARSSSQPPTMQRDAQPNQPDVPPGVRMPIHPLSAPHLNPLNFGAFDNGLRNRDETLRQRATQHTSLGEVTTYLLSSPNGPQALLFSPQHGAYTGSLPRTSSLQNHLSSRGPSPLQPTPTTRLVATPDSQQNHPPVQAPQVDQAAQPQHPAPPAGAQAQQPPQQQPDVLGPMQPFFGPLWLLFRISIFAYFLLGSSMGWRRPIALVLIGFGFWMIRLGLFGDGGLVRRWWDGVVRVEDFRERLRRQGLPIEGAQARNQNVEVQGDQPGAQTNQAPAPAANLQAHRTNMPTPEELAQRLLEERNQNLQRAPIHRLREHIRPVERAIALFVASLWPGVGERYVHALDRDREAEEIARREMQRQREEAEREEAERADKEREEVSEKPDGASAAGTTSIEKESETTEASSGHEKQG